VIPEIDIHDRVIGRVLDDAARRLGDAVFCQFGEEAYTYRQMNELASRCAGGLAELGVHAGERVVVLLRNVPEFLIAWFGIARLGATVVPLNPEWKGETLRYILEDAEPSAVVLSADVFAGVVEALGDQAAVPMVMVGPEAAPLRPTVPWSDLIGAQPMAGDGGRHDAVLAILYSSGTTGRPKGIMMPHAHIYAFSRQWTRVADLKSDDVLYTPTPLFYMLATILGVIPILLVGGRVHIGPRFSASTYWDDVRSCGATVAHAIFSIIPILLKQPPSPLDRQHNCRRIFISKSNAEFEERFGVRLVEIYGSTEMNIVAYNRWDDFRPGTCGKPADNFEVTIVDDDDQPLPTGEVGEIVARPKEPFAISYGYYKRPEVTVEAWRNLWFHCGDRGYLDDDGFLHYVDRKKDVIRRGGENISSYELERVANEHPGVLESAAIPVPSELEEDEVKLCVVTREGSAADPESIIAFLDERLPRFMIPRYIEFLPELPKTGSMKVEKYRLREQGITPATWDAKSARAVGVQGERR
jgi:crotonobetaine/carnitine-CoA ligase